MAQSNTVARPFVASDGKGVTSYRSPTLGDRRFEDRGADEPDSGLILIETTGANSDVVTLIGHRT